jgi:hypothetical protein
MLFKEFHSSFYWRILKKTTGFKNNYKKIREYHFEDQKNLGRKPNKNWSLRRLVFMPSGIPSLENN